MISHDSVNQGQTSMMQLLLFFIFALPFSLYGDESSAEKDDCPRFLEVAKTDHSVQISGKELAYEAICGSCRISEHKEKESASLFFTAYLKKGTPKELSARPICFCFNGGPGSSSIWLHMGFGPMRPIIHSVGYTKPPSTYENNPCSLLAETDLVFIDPVSTGYSKVCEGSNAKQFHGIEEDVDSFADFIRLFLTKFERWHSPKFLMGESYGTIRAVGLAERLHASHFIDLNGVILVSMCLDFQAYDFGNGNDLPHVLALPSYASTAWYHKKLKDKFQQMSLQELLHKVEHFAINEYASALLLGNRLAENEKNAVLEKLSDYTSLDKSYLNACSLRIVTGAFFKELFRKDHKIVGRFDSRYVGVEQYPLEEMSHTDPSFDAIVGPFTSSFHQYLTRELKVNDLAPYRVLNSESVFPWNFSINRLPAGLGYVHMSGKLSSAMEKNPSLRIFIANGYYDLATPYFAADHTMCHLMLTPELFKNVTCRYYPSGHMIYLDPASHKQMQQDLQSFFSLSR